MVLIICLADMKVSCMHFHSFDIYYIHVCQFIALLGIKCRFYRRTFSTKFRKIHRKTTAVAFFLPNLQVGLNFIKKTLSKVFSCDICFNGTPLIVTVKRKTLSFKHSFHNKLSRKIFCKLKISGSCAIILAHGVILPIEAHC